MHMQTITSSSCVLLLLLLSTTWSIVVGDKWAPVATILQNAVNSGAFPGCVAFVGNEEGQVYAQAFGNYTYGAPAPYNRNNPPMQVDTIFDMASCTKVLATTTAIAQFYQRGQLNLDSPVADILGPQFSVNGKGNMTIRNCLLHNSGFPPDPTPSYYSTEFGCPNSENYSPKEDFSCQQQIWKSQMAQNLEWGIGALYTYSDLNFMTLMHVVGVLARNYKYVVSSDLIPLCVSQGSPVSIDQCYFEAYIRRHVIDALGLQDSTFLPNQSLWPRCAPTANDTTYRHAVSQGVVDDSNAYAAGGISGHAGYFSTASDIYTLMHKIMFAGDNDDFMNRTTVNLFIKEYNHSQSSRALGWNTNDPTVYDEGWNQSCGSLSPTTFMHTGFTGTMVCGDPVRKVIVILLTNRVYPTYNNWQILRVRQLFSTAVQQILDAQQQVPTHTLTQQQQQQQPPEKPPH